MPHKLEIRPFEPEDAALVVGWIASLRAMRLWSADHFNRFPLSPDDLNAKYADGSKIPLSFTIGGKVVGHLMLRFQGCERTIVRLGFVVLAPELRGHGFGKKMLALVEEYVKRTYGAQTLSLGVFTENVSALRCYLAAGFSVVANDAYTIDGEPWQGVEMEKMI